MLVKHGAMKNVWQNKATLTSEWSSCCCCWRRWCGRDSWTEIQNL